MGNATIRKEDELYYSVCIMQMKTECPQLYTHCPRFKYCTPYCVIYYLFKMVICIQLPPKAFYDHI